MESILTSIKKLLGPTETYDNFDTDIIQHINSTFAELTQLGVGPPEGYYIEDADNTWDEFLTDPVQLGMAKDYVYISCKLVFDPPTNASVLQSLEKRLSKLEWRLNVDAETNKD